MEPQFGVASSPRNEVWTAQPSDRKNSPWYVWDMYQALPPKPVFVGSMEECQAVAESLNRLRILRREE